MQPQSFASLILPFLGVCLIGGGVFTLSRLLLQPEKRGLNWGKKGATAPCSSTSIVVWGLSLIAFGTFFELTSFSVLHSDVAAISGTVIIMLALLICGFRDSVINNRRTMANHSADSRLASGTSRVTHGKVAKLGTASRLCILIPVLISGGLGVDAVLHGSIAVGRARKIIFRADEPILFWYHTGTCLFFASAGCVALIYSFRIRTDRSHLN